MPRRAGVVGRPADYSVPFPDGDVTAAAPAGIAETVHLVRNLHSAVEELGWSWSHLARQAHIDRTTVHDLIAGRALIDVVTLARLERAVGQGLWQSVASQGSPSA